MWTIKAAEEELDEFMWRIQSVLSVGQIWSVIEGLRLAEDPNEILKNAIQEADEQGLTSPADMTSTDLDQYLDSVIGEGWTPQDIIEEIENQFPQAIRAL